MTLEPKRPGLDRRRAAILRAVIREYVLSGQPIGSQTLAERYRIKASSATIRNDMSLLEELGYLTQPHASAGRIPTDLGYRWFVDNWPGPAWPNLPKRSQDAIDEVFQNDFRGIEEALDSTSHILSELTTSTAVALAPAPRRNTLKRLELVRRGARRATLLLIAHSGEVEQGVVEFPKDTTEVGLARIEQSLNAELAGLAFEDLCAKIEKPKAAQESRAAVAAAIKNLVKHQAGERVFRGGTANILSVDKFADMSTAHEIIEALEHPEIVSHLMDTAKVSGTVLVFIGGEVPVEQMKTCTVVFAPYGAGGDRTGSVGVVGPTRMDYPHTIAAVEAVARSLTRLLEPID